MDEEAITASFGVALRIDYESLDDLIQRTDDALYQAKEQGRNRVIIAEDRIDPC
jgi:diguanylate cyclase